VAAEISLRGKEKLLSFGKYPEITLAIARARREMTKALLADGKDPAKELAAKKKPPPSLGSGLTDQSQR
jgi:hypothetical protein